jgi:tRNA threonylcarbamoyladenosine biosynthesis protein TsaB
MTVAVQYQSKESALNLLLIDTATEIFNVTLKIGTSWYGEYTLKIGLKHSEMLLPTIEKLMTDADFDSSNLDLVVCAKGPGSFTGLRIGMSSAKGISYGTGCGLVSVPTLDAMAYGLDFFEGLVVPVVDARKKSVYTAFYMKGKRITDYLDISTGDMLQEMHRYMNEGNSIFVTGPGKQLLAFDDNPDEHRVIVDKREVFSNATGYINLGVEQFRSHGTDSKDTGPMYLRKSDAELSFKKQASNG